MGTRRRVTAIATSALLLAGVTAAPAEAIGPKRTNRMIVFGHWYSKHRSKWALTTQNSRQDWGRICSAWSGTRKANVRIYAYDSKGRMIGQLARDHHKFAYDDCVRLVLPEKKHARSMLFRINVDKDGYGEKAKRVRVKS